MPPSDDELLLARLRRDPSRGWTVFIERYTPDLVRFIHQAGVADADAAMDVYVRVCERLAADRCARFRSFDPSKGALGAWLRTIVRHVIVDQARGEAGRRRLFGSIAALDAFDRRVFELHYWHEQRPSEIAERVSQERASRVTVTAVMEALQRIEANLTARQRRELAAMAERGRTPRSIDTDEGDPHPVASPEPDPETRAQIAERDRALESALTRLEPEDAAIVRLRFLHELSTATVKSALHLDHLDEARVRQILDRLRQLLMGVLETS